MPIAAATQRITLGAFEAKQRPYMSTNMTQQLLKRMSDGRANRLSSQSPAVAILYTALITQSLFSVPDKVLEQGTRSSAATALSNNKAAFREAVSNVAMQTARHVAADVMSKIKSDVFFAHELLQTNKPERRQADTLAGVNLGIQLARQLVKRVRGQRLLMLMPTPTSLPAGPANVTSPQVNVTMPTPSASH